MVNKVMLIGRVGRLDKESYREVGASGVLNFSLATNNKKKTASGRYEDETTWHKIVVWGFSANFCRDYVSTGDLLYIEGSIRHGEYQKDGQTIKDPTVVATSVQKLSYRDKASVSKVDSDDIPF